MFVFAWVSKLFLFFLSPENWIILLLLIALFKISSKAKRILVVIAGILFLIFSNKVIYNAAITAWQPSPTNLNTTKFEAGILLGGMGWLEKNDIGFFKKSADRYIQAYKLYKQGAISKIIVSAGGMNKDEPTEALFVKRQLLGLGVPDNDVIAEDRSRNTFENATFTKRCIDSLHLKGPFVIITSAIHVRRAALVFKKAGINVITYPCDYEGKRGSFYFTDFFWPDIEVLEKWKYLLKELAGLSAYKLTGKT